MKILIYICIFTDIIQIYRTRIVIDSDVSRQVVGETNRY